MVGPRAVHDLLTRNRRIGIGKHPARLGVSTPADPALSSFKL